MSKCLNSNLHTVLTSYLTFQELIDLPGFNKCYNYFSNKNWWYNIYVYIKHLLDNFDICIKIRIFSWFTVGEEFVIFAQKHSCFPFSSESMNQLIAKVLNQSTEDHWCLRALFNIWNVLILIADLICAQLMITLLCRITSKFLRKLFYNVYNLYFLYHLSLFLILCSK